MINVTQHIKWSLLLFFTYLSCGVSGAKEVKFATVDMQKIYKQYHRTLSEQESINKGHAHKQKIITEKSEAIKALRVAIEKIAAEMKQEGLTGAEKLSKQQEGKFIAQELKMAQRDLRIYSENSQNKIAKIRAMTMRSIMKEIKEVVEKHSEEMGYDFVFDRSGLNTNQVSFFLYLQDAADLTDEVLEKLNHSEPGADTE